MKHEKVKYQINQSPLYKINNPKTLAKILCVDINTIQTIIGKGSQNYYFSNLPGDKRRALEVPKPQLKRIHTRINNLISRISAPDYLYSGVKGCSNVKNAKTHLGDKALLKIDIKNFYPSTTIKMVEKCFQKTFHCTKDIATTLSELCCVNGYLPTGSPISQSISFYTNIGVYNHLNTYSKSRNIRLSVYVDDLTFSGQIIPKSFVDYVTSFIEKNRGYKCHKIRMYKSDTPKVVTGAVIVGHTLKVKNSHRKTIKDLLFGLDGQIKSYKFDSPELNHYFQVLIGHLFSAGQINGRYYQKGKEIVESRKILKLQNQSVKSS
jgi:hypothetical protein